MESQIYVQATVRDLLPAFSAVPELACIHAFERLLQLKLAALSPPLRLQRHGLVLHGVHARQPPDGLLV